MIKRLVVVSMLAIFGLTGYAEAGKGYSSELEGSKAELADIEVKLAAQKAKLNELNKEFNEADIALRQDLIACKADMDEKTHIRESKRREGQLRQEYQAKMKPAKAEYNRLKAARSKCIKKSKSLEKKIDRLANDPYMEKYNEDMDMLKKEMEDAKTIMHDKIAVINDNAGKEIDAITDMSNKSKIKSQILSDAMDKELVLRREYREKKQDISDKMNKLRSEYRKNLAEFRSQRVEPAGKDMGERPARKIRKIDDKPKKSAASTNFTVVR
jgi:chromosome segregation ATPase